MPIRPFKNEDAKFCHMTRSSNFIKLFYEDLGSKVIHAAVNAYMEEDYIEKAASDDYKIFIIEKNKDKAGFIMIKRQDQNTAEIPLIFIDDSFHHKGLGKKLIEYAEHWIKQNWTSVNKIFLDTIIPKYNSDFYKKMGYNELCPSMVRLLELNVKAIRFEKTLSEG